MKEVEDFLKTILTLISIEEAKFEKEGFSDKSVEIAELLAQKLNLTPEEIEKLLVSIKLISLGEIAIPDEIKDKRRKNIELSEKEKEEILNIVNINNILTQDSVVLKPYRDVLINYNEKYDGTGFPNKLKGNQIPKLARTASIVNRFNELTFDKSHSLEQALDILEKGKGKDFDPDIADTLLVSLDKSREQQKPERTNKQKRIDRSR